MRHVARHVLLWGVGGAGRAKPRDTNREVHLLKSHTIKCAGVTIDASNPDRRAVLQRVADRLATSEKPNWRAWEMLAKVIEAGEKAERERTEGLTKMLVDLMDDPGNRGTHSNSEYWEAEGRVGNVRKPWMRQRDKKVRAHIQQKKQAGVRQVTARAEYVR